MRASTYATILVDVDNLKGINDNYGHVIGDELLVSVAEAIRESVRASDICARFGGDEFLIFAAGCDLDAATEIARRILNKVEPRTLERAGFGVSIGIDIAASWPRSSDVPARGPGAVPGQGRGPQPLRDLRRGSGWPDTLHRSLHNAKPRAGLRQRLVPAVVDADLALDAAER